MTYSINDLLLTVQDVCNMESGKVKFSEVEKYITEYGINYKQGKKEINEFLSKYYA